VNLAFAQRAYIMVRRMTACTDSVLADYDSDSYRAPRLMPGANFGEEWLALLDASRYRIRKQVAVAEPRHGGLQRQTVVVLRHQVRGFLGTFHISLHQLPDNYGSSVAVDALSATATEHRLKR